MNENPTDAKEQYELGNNYDSGLNGLPEDREKAFYWYKKAAEQGLADAQQALGDWYGGAVYRAEQGGDQTTMVDDKKNMVFWLTKAAEQGLVDAQLNLANRCEEECELIEEFKRMGVYEEVCKKGILIDEPAEKMVFWLTKAAEQGDVTAQTDLFVHYKQGKFVPRNAEKMVFWLTKAAEQGDELAQDDLGRCYMGEFGQDVPKDKEKAVFWLTKAAEQGSEISERRLASVRGGGGGGGCYIATCVYGSYDCPQVWTLRRYRDHWLSMSWFGRRFIQIYYAVSPTVVRLFGGKNWFNGLCKPVIDNIVRKLQSSGIDGSPYSDV